MSEEQPNAPDLAEQLRLVREIRGVQNLRVFWQDLTKGGDYEISYDAVRTYDKGREPPPSFLRQVAKVYRINLAWLIGGEGPATVEEAAAKRETEEANDWILGLMDARFGRGADNPLPLPLRAAFSALVVRYHFARQALAHEKLVSPSNMEQDADWIATFVREPLAHLGKHVPQERFDRYIEAMLHALALAAEPVGVNWSTNHDLFDGEES